MRLNKKFFAYLLFLLAILLKFYLLWTGLTSSNLTVLVVKIALLGLCFIYAFVAKIRIKISRENILIVCVCLLMTIISRDLNLIFLLVFGIIFSSLSQKEYLSIEFKTLIFFFILSIVLSKIGIIDDSVQHRIDGDTIYDRQTFGLTHPNTVFFYLFLITLLYYLVKKRFDWKDRLLVIVVSVVFYYLTYSRTGFICICVFLILEFISHLHIRSKKESFLYKNKDTLLKMIVPLYFAATILTFLIALLFGNSYTMNKILSQRPSFWLYYIQNGQIFSLFGTELFSYYYIDSLTLNLLVFQGIIGYVCYGIMFVLCAKTIVKNKDYKMAFVYSMVLFYTLFEANIFGYAENILILCYFIHIFSTKKEVVACESIN